MAVWCLGVDLGTSFSAAAISTGGEPEIIEIGGEKRIPSTVLLSEQGVLIAGRVAQRSIARYPERAERNPKRYVGKGSLLLGGVAVEVSDALQAILALFVDEGRRRFDGADPSCLVLTCPVAWTAERRDVLKAAGRAAVPQARVVVIDEPVAAALHYASAHRVSGGKRVAVYDLGGGTFDTAVLEADGADFKAVGVPGGDDAIGGEVFDERVYEFFSRQLEQSRPEFVAELNSNPDRKYLATAAAILDEARIAKETLSAFEVASQYISEADADVRITRGDLDGMVKADLARTAEILDDTLKRAKTTRGDLAGIFLTGGASRMPLVHQILSERHGDLVRTSDDPKTVVALGAARLGSTFSKSDQSGPVLRNVLEVRSAAGGIYAVCLEEGGNVFLRHLDVSMEVDRELRFGSIADWAVSDEGVVVAERLPDGTWVRTLTPELIIRSGRRLPAMGKVQVLAEGRTGWAFFQSRPPTAVSSSVGLPWGETADMSMIEIDLGEFFVQETPSMLLGDSARWFVNEDNQQRRLFDQDSPTGGAPALTGGASGCVVVLGQFSSRKSFFGGVHQNFTAWQVLCMVQPGGKIRRVERRSPNWLQQVVVHDDKWFVSTSAGLEIDAAPQPPVALAPRKRGAALRWFPAGGEMYAIGMDTVVPAKGWSIRHYDAAAETLRTLASEPRTRLLGHLASRLHAERPRVIADGESLWLAVSGEEKNTSRILHVTPKGVREVHRAQGWIEPVARVADDLLCLHRADASPGTEQRLPGDLVRIAV
ncbi:Hsp70 family protein [Microbispora sp. H11081]|uniref:Hsp70 family protein n=1 Tax=Microbispora sp. H11081 TaxID=2729107 RepID=UPI00147421FC|nr:Hsp70 family protein [Microbispora sp. H11081]